jgi:hypothetical protein
MPARWLAAFCFSRAGCRYVKQMSTGQGWAKSAIESVTMTVELGLVRHAVGTYPCLMAKPTDKSMSLFSALASAAATAYALAYIAHAEWGIPRLIIREDAIGMAGLLVAAICLKIAFQRKNKGS